MDRSFHLKATVKEIREALESDMRGKRIALQRLQQALNIAFESNKLDLEEIDHLNKIMQMLRDSPGAIRWADILDFHGGSA